MISYSARSTRSRSLHSGAYVIAWKRGIAILTAGNVKVSPDPRLGLVNGHYLQIENAVPQDGGEYVCQIATLEPIEITHLVDILGTSVYPHNTIRWWKEWRSGQIEVLPNNLSALSILKWFRSGTLLLMLLLLFPMIAHREIRQTGNLTPFLASASTAVAVPPFLFVSGQCNPKSAGESNNSSEVSLVHRSHIHFRTHQFPFPVPPVIHHVTSGGHLQIKKGSPVSIECLAYGEMENYPRVSSLYLLDLFSPPPRCELQEIRRPT